MFLGHFSRFLQFFERFFFNFSKQFGNVLLWFSSVLKLIGIGNVITLAKTIFWGETVQYDATLAMFIFY
jgi:hypothetical protein